MIPQQRKHFACSHFVRLFRAVMAKIYTYIPLVHRGASMIEATPAFRFPCLQNGEGAILLERSVG